MNKYKNIFVGSGNAFEIHRPSCRNDVVTHWDQPIETRGMKIKLVVGIVLDFGLGQIGHFTGFTKYKVGLLAAN